MRLYPAIAWLAFLHTFSIWALAQPIFSLGSKYGAGISPNQPGSTYPTPTQTTFHQYNLHRGLIIQYLLTNTIGVETGMALIDYGYARKKQFPIHSRDEPFIDVFDYHVPFLLVVQKRHRFKTLTSYKLVAGTSADMMASAFENHHTPALWLKNIILGIRICNEKLKHGRLEYGIEYQNSIEGFTLKTNDPTLGPVELHAKLNLVALTIHYFIITKNFKRSPVTE